MQVFFTNILKNMATVVLSRGCRLPRVILARHVHRRMKGPVQMERAFDRKSIRYTLKSKREERTAQLEPRSWPQPQLRTARRLDSQMTESRQCTNNMPLVPVNAAVFNAAAKAVSHGAVLIKLRAAVLSKNVCRRTVNSKR